MRGLRDWLGLCVIVVGAMSSLALAGEPMTRIQALRALIAHNPAERHAAAVRLGTVGTMADVPLLVRNLRSDDTELRRLTETAIEEIWAKSGDNTIDALYRQGIQQMNAGASGEAIATFSRIIERKPAFAEAWNKRATLYYFLGDYEKSLHDCAEVIKRNPLHFGALSGYGLIYMKLNQPQRALEYFRQALAINPNLDDVAAHARVLERMLEKKQGQYI